MLRINDPQKYKVLYALGINSNVIQLASVQHLVFLRMITKSMFFFVSVAHFMLYIKQIRRSDLSSEYDHINIDSIS